MIPHRRWIVVLLGLAGAGTLIGAIYLKHAGAITPAVLLLGLLLIANHAAGGLVLAGAARMLIKRRSRR